MEFYAYTLELVVILYFLNYPFMALTIIRRAVVTKAVLRVHFLLTFLGGGEKKLQLY